MGLNFWPRKGAPSGNQKQIAAILCDRCQKIFAKGRVFDDGIVVTKVHPSITSVKSAADHGCRLCALLQTSFHDGDSDGPIYFSLCGDDRQIDLDFSNKLGFVRPFKLRWKSGTSPTTDESTNHLATQLARSNTCSSSSLSMAKNWYNSCIKNHVSCKRIDPGEEVRGTWNPTRLLDVGGIGACDHVQLVYRDSLSDAVPYAALSHCWGNYQHLRLSESNLQGFQEGIPLQQLSKTFHDAVIVTQRLGIKYLWIDSLCIVQDSQEDWSAESVMMGKLYRYCSCCIAATSAKDGQMGCFVKRDLRPLRIPQQRPIRVAGSRADKNESPGYYECSDPEIWQTEVENSILSERAWAYQERILSRRVLHFGASQVFWECADMVISESHSGYKIEKNIKVDFWAPDGSVLNDTQAVRRHAYSFWVDAVEAYTPKKLTRDEDKIVAIAGIAKMVQHALKDDYIAGLWMGNLLQGLLWRAKIRYARPPTRWRAPSWSWASVNSGVVMHRHHSQSLFCLGCRERAEFHRHTRPGDVPFVELASIDEVHIETIGNDPMGAVTEAHIRMTGRAIPAMVTEDSSGRISLGIFMRTNFGMEGRNPCIIADDTSIFLDRALGGKRIAVSCLPLLAENDYQNTISGLLLIPLSDSKGTRTYQRIGAFVLDRDHGYDKAYWPQRFSSDIQLGKAGWDDLLNRLQGELAPDLTAINLE